MEISQGLNCVVCSPRRVLQPCLLSQAGASDIFWNNKSLLFRACSDLATRGGIESTLRRNKGFLWLRPVPWVWEQDGLYSVREV